MASLTVELNTVRGRNRVARETGSLPEIAVESVHEELLPRRPGKTFSPKGKLTKKSPARG